MAFLLSFEGPVAVLQWDDGENRVNSDTLVELNHRLDDVEATEGPVALVLTGSGKFFSNGMDLNRFAADSEEFASTLEELHLTAARLMLFPAYTVAAINGHAFAAGAIFSCAFDSRVMRDDRGYWCLNEAEIGITIGKKAWSVLTHRLPFATAVRAVTTAKRYSGPEALSAGIVEMTASESDVMVLAMNEAERASALNRRTLAKHKRLAHGDEAAFLGLSRPPKA